MSGRVIAAAPTLIATELHGNDEESASSPPTATTWTRRPQRWPRSRPRQQRLAARHEVPGEALADLASAHLLRFAGRG